MGGQSLYYGMNALSHNVIMADRKRLKAPKGLYCKGTVIHRKTQAGRPFAAQTDGQPWERNSKKNGTTSREYQYRRNNLSSPMTCSNAGKFFQKLFEKGSDLPPVFLLLVRGCNPILPIPDYATAMRGRRLTSVFYTISTHNSITKGANTMKTAKNSAAMTRDSAEPSKFLKRIGSTTYVVSVHFSRTTTETIEDKIFKLIESEVKKTA